MIGLDTNVLVRFLVGDHRQQFERAHGLIRQELRRGEPVMISLLVLMETEWVLRSRYAYSKSEIAGVFSALLDAADLRVEAEEVLEEALYHWRDSPADFADCLIGARHRALGCRSTATFDTNAAELPDFLPI